MTLLSIVVPTHNETTNVGLLHGRIAAVFQGLPDYDFELIFSDDSTDQTPQVIARLHEADPRVKLIRMSRRFGQSIAITAGLDYASGDAVIMMDADLQDPPEVIPQLLAAWKDGNEIVYVQRASASTYRLYKFFSYGYYRMLRKIASVEIPVDAGEFRLLDRKVVEYLKRLTEHTRYLRGLTVLPGFRQKGIPIQRAGRLHGETNYNFKRSAMVAIDGILSFSTVPLRLATLAGAALTVAGFLLGAVFLLWKLNRPEFSLGIAGLFVAMFFFSGFQLLILGVFGEYLAKIFVEVQNRPAYWIDYQLGFEGQRPPADRTALRPEPPHTNIVK